MIEKSSSGTGGASGLLRTLRKPSGKESGCVQLSPLAPGRVGKRQRLMQARLVSHHSRRRHVALEEKMPPHCSGTLTILL